MRFESVTIFLTRNFLMHTHLHIWLSLESRKRKKRTVKSKNSKCKKPTTPKNADIHKKTRKFHVFFNEVF